MPWFIPLISLAQVAIAFYYAYEVLLMVWDATRDTPPPPLAARSRSSACVAPLAFASSGRSRLEAAGRCVGVCVCVCVSLASGERRARSAM